MYMSSIVEHSAKEERRAAKQNCSITNNAIHYTDTFTLFSSHRQYDVNCAVYVDLHSNWIGIFHQYFVAK